MSDCGFPRVAIFQKKEWHPGGGDAFLYAGGVVNDEFLSEKLRSCQFLEAVSPPMSTCPLSWTRLFFGTKIW